jgi:hypothetical protein
MKQFFKLSDTTLKARNPSWRQAAVWANAPKAPMFVYEQSFYLS